VFNRLAPWKDGIFAVVEPGAFSGCLDDRRIPALVNHDPHMFLGDTRSGSLRLHQDNVGLFARLVLPDNERGRWVKAETFACRLTGWSFKWLTPDGGWERRDVKGHAVHILRRFSRLSEVSLAHSPTFRHTTLSWRP
jgi:HK97 family phage prohead protease